MGTGMKSLKWEGIGTKNLFLHTFTLKVVVDTVFLETALSTDLCTVYFFQRVKLRCLCFCSWL